MYILILVAGEDLWATVLSRIGEGKLDRLCFDIEQYFSLAYWFSESEIDKL